MKIFSPNLDESRMTPGTSKKLESRRKLEDSHPCLWPPGKVKVKVHESGIKW